MRIRSRTFFLPAGGAAYIREDGSGFATGDPFSGQVFYNSKGHVFYEMRCITKQGSLSNRVVYFQNPESGQISMLHIHNQILEHDGMTYHLDKEKKSIEVILLPEERVPVYLLKQANGGLLYVSSGEKLSLASFRLFAGKPPKLREILVKSTVRIRDDGSTFIWTTAGQLCVPFAGQPTWEGELLDWLKLSGFEIAETENGVTVTALQNPTNSGEQRSTVR